MTPRGFSERAAPAALLVVALALGGCVTIHQPAGGNPSLERAPGVPDPTWTSGAAVGLPPPVPPVQDQRALERLNALRAERMQESYPIDTPIGVGDVLEVSVPNMQELSLRTVRVAGDGTFSLPFVGVVHAAGRTEEQVRAEIAARLGNVMYDPQVGVFVREYRSREVAVLGSVGRPGTYTPTSASDTILDMIAVARGITDTGSRQVVFIPRGSGQAAAEALDLADLPVDGMSVTEVSGMLRNVDPIVLNLREMTAGMSEAVLSLPVRAGDVIIIPEAGKVFVQGWIEKAGPYVITRDLTMLAVVAAAGGPMFPADLKAARLMRAGVDGERHLYDVDLEAIAQGEIPDVYVQANDVIELGATPPKLALYGVYYFFTTVLRLGAAVTVF